jgi:signal transduction histidine kinase/CheY-like chemotaxis protein
MSKREINSRINQLFNGLQEPASSDDQFSNSLSLKSYSWEIDEHGVYTDCGNEISDILGFDKKEVIGNPFISFQLPIEEQGKLRGALESEEFPCEIDLTFLTKARNELSTRCTIFLNKDKEGILIGYRGIVQMIDGSNSPSLSTFNADDEGQTKILVLPEVDEVDIDQQSYGIQTGRLPVIAEDEEISHSENSQKKGVRKKREVKPKNIESPKQTLMSPKGIQTAPLSPLFPSPADSKRTELPTLPDSFVGLALMNENFSTSESAWTQHAAFSLIQNQTISQSAEVDSPAVLVSPVKLRDQKTGVIEIVDTSPDRKWTEEDRLLIQEISNQLGLALENVQLYAAIQKELKERVKAEEETSRRNKDLAILNEIGQRLSRLVGREEIFEIIASMTQKILYKNNLLLALVDKEKQLLTFPVCLMDGIPQTLSARELHNGYQELILRNKTPMLVNENLINVISEPKFDHPRSKPLSLLAVPLLSADKAIGVISVFDYEMENAFDQVQSELLSTIASQTATALENTNLFTEIRDALELIEVRERYQLYVTNAVAALSEKGSKEIEFLLKSLADASLCERVYYAETHEDNNGEHYWKPKASTIQKEIEQPLDRILFDQFPNWLSELKTTGWISCTKVNCTEPEINYLNDHHIESILLIAIKLENDEINFISFENLKTSEVWKPEQIDILRIATDAFNNTLIREGLLDQVQTSLSETESLYSASHKLALANDMQEMIVAIVEGVNIKAINRGVIVLFERDDKGEVTRMSVESNYHSGSGTPPPVPGTEYLVSLYKPIFITQNPVFYDDLLEIQIESSLQDILTRQNIRSMAVLPLWSGNQQLGVLLLQAGQKHIFTSQETRSYPPLVDQLSTAIQNLRLFETTQSALSETELLYKISSGIAKSTNMEELVRLVGENILPEKADTLWLLITQFNKQTSAYDFEIIGSYDNHASYKKSGLRLDSSIFAFVDFIKNEPLALRDISKSSLPASTQAVFKNLNISSTILIPLQTAGTPAGLLIASSKRMVDFESEEIHTLQIVGNSIAVAIERQRLLFEAQRRALELQTAAEIARDTTSTLSFDILLNRIVNLLKERFNYYHCSIFLVDDKNTYAEIQESTGEAGFELKRRNYRLAVGSKSVIGACTATGETILVNDTTRNPIYYPNPLLPETRSELGLPLKITGKVIGALDLQSRELNAFSENEITVLQILTDQISVAIENAKAYAISQEAVEEMRELDRVKSQFLANMSHELRTPLNSVIGFSRVILKGIDGPINDVQQQDITAIYNSGMHLLNMINEILDLSKIDAGKMELQLEDVNISDVINTAITNTTGLVKDKPIELIQKVPADLPLIKADEIRISQVLINLISNAVKFTDKGTIKVEASISMTSDNKPELLVTVTDTGMGISAEDQLKLFQRFSQVDDSPTRKTGGTGLGLSICRSLIELHGGKIGLQSSQVGKGSVFYFTLPMPGFVPGYNLDQLTHGENVILAIDDDPQVISLYDRFLKTQGFEVIALSDASMAVERARELKPFAITLDIMMPQKDGWQVLRELKQDPETREIPILICSILQEEEKGYSLGASEYLVKPFLQDDLINAISRLTKVGTTSQVLVVDDDADDLRLIQKMVEQNNTLHLSLAQGGEEALEILQKSTPDVIIMDLFMPNINGFDLLDKIKIDARLNRIPVIVLTGADLNADQQKQLSEYSEQLLTKSVLKESDLLNNIEQALLKIKTRITESYGKN